MGQILMWIVVIVVFALIVASWDEQQKRQRAIDDLRRAKADFLKALSQGNITALLAYGSFSAPPAEVFESAEKLAGGVLEAELIWRETEKWRVLNFGGLIASGLLDLGTVTLVYAADGSVAVRDSKAPPNPYDVNRAKIPEPFTPQDFRLSQPSPNMATLSYDSFVAWAVVELHWQQEEDEQAQNRTIYRNGVGFNATDAKVFSPMAEEFLRGAEISAEQLEICRRPLENGLPWLGKYRRQLARLFDDEPSIGSNVEASPESSEEPKRLLAA